MPVRQGTECDLRGGSDICCSAAGSRILLLSYGKAFVTNEYILQTRLCTDWCWWPGASHAICFVFGSA